MPVFKEARKRKGLTQKALAELVGTTQQQIQRLETGNSLPSLKLAYAITKALDCPLSSLFPGSYDVVETVCDRISNERAFTDDDLDEAADAGIELDPTIWHFKAFVSGRTEPLFIEVDPRERRRLYRVLQVDERAGYNDFLMVNGRSEVVLVNKKCLDHVELLEDRLPPGSVVDSDTAEESGEDSTNLVIEFISGGTHRVPVEHQLIIDPEGQDEDSELKTLFYELEAGHIKESARVVFQDADGDECLLRPASVKLIHIPYGIFFYEEDEDEG